MNSVKAQAFVRLQFKRLKRNFSTASFKLREVRQHENESAFAWYSRQLDERPIVTKAASAAVISSTGNILAQYIKFHTDQEEAKEDYETRMANANGETALAELREEEKKFIVQWGAVGRFAFLNAVFVAPVLHHWYSFINRSVPGTSIARVMQRTFWDEFVFSPIYIPAFLGGLWTLEGTSPDKIKTMLSNELGQIIVAEWILWVPTMLVTFRYAPVKFQVLVINCVGVVWQTFLSFMANNAHDKQEVVDDNNNNNKVAKKNRFKEVMGTIGGITETYLDEIFFQIEAW
ncbi:unnamed protein product [Cylindrotheca closterium]|uniref:Uncharacterized protein n=1 Tax=Cylindrotheca closterium TaxID=2856 RepID=A0AAD2FR46_9STRA|nr:unnamed protein product [Cylindrotheca closterium]